MLTAMVVGCGRIGALFDTPGQDAVLTHAHAYSLHPSVRLAALVDTDLKNLAKARKKWAAPSFTDLGEALERVRPDIVSVCVPDGAHFAALETCLEAEVPAVAAEKPLTTDLESSKWIAQRFETRGVPLAVNFSRRFDPMVQELKTQLERQKLGELFHAVIRYSKGVLHNGSHAMDLCRCLFGECRSVQVLGGRVDFCPTDPTISALLTFDGCPMVCLLGCDETAYSIFEVEVVGSQGRTNFVRSGLAMRKYDRRDDPLYDGYVELVEGPLQDTRLTGAMSAMIGNLVNHLERGDRLLCTGQDAVEAQTICDSLLNAYRKAEP